jgi:intracellular septation protein A
MKKSLMQAVVFIVLGIALLVVSLFAKNTTTMNWSSFGLGGATPMFIAAVIFIIKYVKQSKQQVQAN